METKGSSLSTEPAKNTAEGFWRSFFAHPLTQAIAFLTGIFGVYAYYDSIREPYLTYYISPTRTAIVNKGNLNNLSVNFNGIQFTNDLSAVEIQIWNQGKLPIRTDDILKTITIKTQNGGRIYQKTATTTRDVVGFNWINPETAQTGTLEFNWKILEHDDGIKIILFYGGNTSVTITIDGTIVDQKKITKYDGNEKSKSVTPFHKWIFVICCGLGFVIAYFVIKIELGLKNIQFRKYPTIKIELLRLCLMIPTALTGAAIALLSNYFESLDKPPFGF